MRGLDERTGSLYVDLEVRVRRDHPVRTIREIVNAALQDMDRDFAVLYPPGFGRPSIAPERLLRAMLLQAFYGIRSERQLMERMEFDLLFRWFVGLGVDEPAWDHSSFTKNRDRLLEGDIAAKFLRAVLAQPRVKRLLSSDHFSVDGTLIEAWASIKSFRRKDGDDNDPDGAGRNAERGFHKEKRSNDTHQSTSDPQARLYKKGNGQPAKLCYMGHALMENRHGLVVALVHDEYGHFEGIVTPADILEAITGVFRSDLDAGEEEENAVRREDGSWLLAGYMPADEMADLLGIDLPEDRDYETVAGHVLSYLHHLPNTGETVDAGGWRFEVVDMDGRRIDKVIATRLVPGQREVMF